MSMILTCPHCGNVWNYSGSCDRATCPLCRGKVPTADNQVDEIQDVLINIQNRLDSISDKAKRGDKALKQLNGDDTYKSIKRMLLDLENRVEALESEKTDESETEPSDQ